LADSAAFWDGMFATCRRARVTNLEVHSYASVACAIPKSQYETYRVPRTEYVINLSEPDLCGPLRANCRRSINRARREGMSIRRSTSETDALIHCGLLAESMVRRQGRGENVSAVANPKPILAYLRSGSGILIQAIWSDEVVSSMLVLLSQNGCYEQSSGTSVEGMKRCASHFLVFEAASQLKSEGKVVFNLGGVSGDNPGLVLFKTGFGPEERRLEAVDLELGSRFHRTLVSTLRSLRGGGSWLRNLGRLPACQSSGS
jgi:lipid II:glycine glycyltransferase (peptidoglycan interpeptide bridge formation enzyme)